MTKPHKFFIRASITAGGEQAESSLAEREKKRERAASVLRDAGLKRAKTHSLRSHSLLSYCASYSLLALLESCCRIY